MFYFIVVLLIYKRYSTSLVTHLPIMARKKSASKKARELEQKNGGVAAVVTGSSEDAPVSKPAAEAKKAEKIADFSMVESDDDEDVEESSEEEDDFGELITEDVEEGINKVLNAIKTGDKSLFDNNVRFFDDKSKDGSTDSKQKADKPIYLKDYHRMNLLDGNAFEDENGEERDWKEGEKPYALQQKEDKEKLLSEIKDAFNGGDADDASDMEDGFLQKKERKTKIDDGLGDLKLPDPNQDGEQFLQAYMDKHAWIGNSKDTKYTLEEDDEDFDDAAERFENAYNFRYEDSNAAEIISYARTQATMRRDKTNSRKRQRQKDNEEKQKDEKITEDLLKKKKQKKVNVIVDRLKQIKEAVGEEVSDETISKVFGDSLLTDDFDDADWDAKMNEIFNEQYYDADDAKPEWNDDDEIMGDLKKSDKDDNDSEEEVAEEEEDNDDDEEEAEEEKVVEEHKSKKSKKKEEKYSKKKEKESLRETAEKIVKANTLQLLQEVEEERGRGKERDVTFKYRDVSPETFGLSTREILLADDKDLNEFIGIKKFAPYRSDESKIKDRRKYAKKRRLKEWRKQVFHNENGPQVEEGEDENIVKIPSIVNKGNKSKHHQNRSKDHRKKASK